MIVAPGQGAQSPGFLTPWLEDPDFRDRFEWLSTVASIDLVHYGTEADADEIRRTEIAQPLLVATGLVAALGIFPHPTDAFGKVSAVAGHSVGELTAAAGARVITAEQAMVLVRERGKAMAEAAAVTDDRHDRRPRWGPGGRARRHREARAHRRQRQRPRPGRRGRHPRAAPGARRRAAGEGPARAAERGRRLPHPHMEPAVGHLGAAGPLGVGARPAHPVRLQQGRPGRPRRPRRAPPDRRPDRQPGPLGPLHGHLRRPRRHRHPRDAAGRHPDRHRQAGAQGRRDLRPQVPRPARRGPGLLRQARRVRRDRHLADLADGRLARPRAPSTSPPRPPTPTCCRPARPSARWPASATGSRVTAAHGGQVVEWLVEDGDLVSPGQPLLRLHPAGGAA